MSIWLLLVDHRFQAMGSCFEVGAFSDHDNINTLKERVKEKKPEALSRAHVDPSDLTVWKTKGSMAIDESNLERLAEILGSINVDNKDTIEKLFEVKRVAKLGLSDTQVLLVQLPVPKVITNAGDDDSKAATISIWLLLVDHTFQTPIGEHFEVGAISGHDNINTLKEKVKEKRRNGLANVDAAELTVWKTKDPLVIKRSNFKHLRGILEGITVDDEDTIEVLDPGDRVANLGLSDGETLFVRLPDPRVITNAGDDDSEARDTLPNLKEYDRYNKTVATLGPSPSEGAKSTGYRKIQANVAQAMYDGRTVLDSLSTISPPVTIFHTIFDEFISSVNDSNTHPTADDLKHVYEFMSIVSDISESEKTYSNGLLPQLRRILKADVRQEQSPDGTRPDGREIGGGGCDPTTQVGLSMRRFWIDDSTKDIREKCCCPTFLVGAGGPWLSVLGAVFTDKFIVQRLTDMKWMALSSTEEDIRVYYNAKSLDGASAPRFVANEPHPRYFPYLTSFTAGDGSVTEFRYLRSLEQDAACVTYLAETLSNKRKVVVKFVSRYSKEAGSPVFFSNPLPQVLTGGRISCTWLSWTISTLDATPPHDVSAQIQTILTRLHSNGYVFGDLRKQNILFDADGKVKLIDFNWCGRYDMSDTDEGLPDEMRQHIEQNKCVQVGDNPYAHYPLSMSTVKGMWAPGMEPLAPIRPIHDWAMFKRLLWQQ
ncbi:hypothetical protein EDB87DRAFT_1715971 [Lactarius vividus]|nr:hypothetical protein EDB87DRAFT_1715971 [Lactarius vividus]